MTTENNPKPLLGLGIAGNSAGHLQQTGEIKAFDEIADISKPQALFPFYIAQAKEAYLARDPYSDNKLRLPENQQAKVQMEPELALKMTAYYDPQGQLINLQAISMTVLNDATYRNAQVDKLAEKKNWGAASKGLALHEIPIEQFSAGSKLDHYRLCGFHQRQGKWQLCGQDVALTQYSYFYEDLLHWLVKQIQSQQDQGALHNIQSLLEQAGLPEQILLAIGASTYTDYGKEHRLSAGDQSLVVLYDSRTYLFQDVSDLIEKTEDLQLLSDDQIIFLQQQVV